MPTHQICNFAPFWKLPSLKLLYFGFPTLPQLQTLHLNWFKIFIIFILGASFLSPKWSKRVKVPIHHLLNFDYFQEVPRAKVLNFPFGTCFEIKIESFCTVHFFLLSLPNLQQNCCHYLEKPFSGFRNPESSKIDSMTHWTISQCLTINLCAPSLATTSLSKHSWLILCHLGRFFSLSDPEWISKFAKIGSLKSFILGCVVKFF